jgi:pimeloyl-ACP methyl ester carboxylesterase
MDHEMVAPQVADLSPTQRVITWDERGFGLTEYDGKPFSFWDSAADCLGLLDHLGIDPAESPRWIAKWRERDKEFIRVPFDCLHGREDITDRLGEIRCPALVVHGTEDGAIPMERAEALAAGLPD